jgi:hypothetical protein
MNQTLSATIHANSASVVALATSAPSKRTASRVFAAKFVAVTTHDATRLRAAITNASRATSSRRVSTSTRPTASSHARMRDAS